MPPFVPCFKENNPVFGMSRLQSVLHNPEAGQVRGGRAGAAGTTAAAATTAAGGYS